jgi:hypothetical protein
MHESWPAGHWQTLFTHIAPGLQVTIPHITPPELDEPVLAVPVLVLVPLELIVPVEAVDMPPVPLDMVAPPVEPVEPLLAPPVPVPPVFVVPPQPSATPPSTRKEQRALRSAMASTSCDEKWTPEGNGFIAPNAIAMQPRFGGERGKRASRHSRRAPRR